ncbi:CDP-glycerol glycerophosphotransferase family protein [Bacillus sp. FJAT-49736]|uniref:CDP-glycerol glycerophosphotransferase family protein n=1 Tax=Bacillus sp. FJAT-49736 TaxID=2833582 RepID=UPI001BC95110|nr:CDP-glycerol glycerophosphotransferase family protein [Bacillus sp. FJAT-49736]MBS4174951.1 CDP-glycerol glycerophosphotransferase family protein [Bacillus sp. FJAT-49736]
MSSLRLIPTIIVKYTMKSIYSCFCLFLKINKQKITFASYRSDTLKDNLYFVWEEFQRQSPDYHYHFVFKKFHSSIRGKIDYFFHLVKAMYEMATSRFFIIDDYYFPVYVIKPRKGTEVIQLWHGSGALKKVGLSTIGKPFGPSEKYLRHVKIHSNYARVYVSAAEVVKYYSEAFGMPAKQIYPFGVPRTDYFFSENKRESLKKIIYERYPELRQKKLLLYAPTYRGKSHYQDAFTCPLHIGEMREKLGENYALLIHLHPYMQDGIEIADDERDFAYHLKDSFTIQELLSLADILITDYSTVFFDFSLLGRPIAFFADDLEQYISERDFYYDYLDIIPGPFFTETNQLTEWIAEGNFDLKRVTAFRNRFFDHIDGKAAKRIVRHLLEDVTIQHKEIKNDHDIRKEGAV